MNTLVFFHVLVAMFAVGGLIMAAVACRHGLWGIAQGAGVAVLAATIAAIGLGEGLAADEGAEGWWLDASRGLTVFGLLLGGGLLVLVTGPSRAHRLAVPLAFVLVLVGLATAFVMAAKPS